MQLNNSCIFNGLLLFTLQPRLRRRLGQWWKQHSFPAETKWPSLAVTKLLNYRTPQVIIRKFKLLQARTSRKVCLHREKCLSTHCTRTVRETTTNRQKFFSFFVFFIASLPLFWFHFSDI